MSRTPLILLVEDNPANRLLATTLLEREGYEVDLAGTSEEVFQRLHIRRPDLILMDIQLPGHDGLYVTRQLKADPATQDITVVALTAHAMAGDREQALAVGCAGYLSKPIDTRMFGAQIREFLGMDATPSRANRREETG
jgi:CheY-like chemotaxis protein